MKARFLKKMASALMMVVSLLFSCTAMAAFNHTITVTVVDAATNEPIEGAVVLVQWTKTTGFGFKATSNYKVVEVVSDENGELTIPGLFKFGVNSPVVNVYKKGYVAWNSEDIFPSYEKRKDFKWRNGYEFRLEHFKSEYSYKKHVFFLDVSNSASGFGLLEKAYLWESALARKE